MERPASECPAFQRLAERAAVLIDTDAIYPQHDYINRFHVVVKVRNGKVVEMREHTDRNASIKAGFPDI